MLSTFGVMFAPDHVKAASELARVCRPGGRIGLANWTPAGFIGQLFKTLGRHLPPPAGAQSPAAWGDEAHLHELLDQDAATIAVTPKIFNFRYRSAAHFIDVFRSWYGPVHKAFAALPADKAETLERDLTELLNGLNRAGPRLAGGAERIPRDRHHAALNDRAAMEPRLQRRVQRYGWDLAAACYEPLWQAQLASAHAELRCRAALAPGERVLDAACGTGLVAFQAARAVGPRGQVVGVDLSGEMIEAAPRRAPRNVANVTFARMDAEALALPDASFDVALCALGLMYVPEPEPALRELRRVLRPGGRLVVAVWGERTRCGWAPVFTIVESEIASEVCPLFFRLGQDDTLARLCADLAFEAIEQRRMAATLAYADADEACDAAFVGGPVALAWTRFDAAARAARAPRYVEAIDGWRDGAGYRVPSEFVVVTAAARRGAASVDAARRAQAAAASRGRTAEHGAGRFFVGPCQTQQPSSPRRLADQLHSHRQAARAEADRNADARQPREGGDDDDLHPAVIGVHRAAGDLLRPALADRERPDLRRRQGENVDALEQRQHVLVEGAALDARGHHLRAGERRAVVVLPQGLGLDEGAVRGLLQVWRDAAVKQPPAPDQPRVPDARGRKAQRRRLDRAADRREPRQPFGADAEDAVFDREIAVEIAEPADARRRSARTIGPQRAAPRTTARRRARAARAGRSRPARRAAARGRAPCAPSALRCRSA